MDSAALYGKSMIKVSLKRIEEIKDIEKIKNIIKSPVRHIKNAGPGDFASKERTAEKLRIKANMDQDFKWPGLGQALEKHSF
jgi:hypothetical protein